ncbi:hypothetical protein BDV38DRAFT_280691 [Aspergillus pseudotamarii]|uniref:PrpF protein-domain-containing protein n=1 Tax=Aspergillus pseudotamarii TaxID=132259 RepID=A0A5N6T174_ASPPS|nr:uncharacterized protein BDV38DRAFT_280691 [Aspergillus pseudotamarii]KAE8139773.1 hypothetical protein BDV38DRAFT_280691 [Aspergillus pseudotamarii]
MGGATSTTSKVAIIRKSEIPGVDVDYTFIKIAPDQAQVDMTGNCGNRASGVGPFALDEELGRPTRRGQRMMDITVINTNTQQIPVETVHVTSAGKLSEGGDYSIAGLEVPLKSPFCIQVDARWVQKVALMRLILKYCPSTWGNLIPAFRWRGLSASALREAYQEQWHGIFGAKNTQRMTTMPLQNGKPCRLVDVEAKLETHENGETSVESVSVFRSTRRLFDGKAFDRLESQVVGLIR